MVLLRLRSTAIVISIAVVYACLQPGLSFASPYFASAQVSAPAPESVRIGYPYGCGVDYRCDPRPGYGRRYYRYGSRDGVTIHNNYGTVNVYTNRNRRYRGLSRFDRRYIYHRHYHYHYRCDGIECDRFRRSDRDYDRGDDTIPVPAAAALPADTLPALQCGGYPCDQNCGPSCWYGRFKNGYCGHGCEVYKERVRYDTEEKLVKVPRVVYGDTSSSSVVDTDLDRDRERRDDQRYEQDRAEPQRRYEGPVYPSR